MTTWRCARCRQPQTEPKPHPLVKYCPPCRPLMKKEQTAAYQKAHLADHRSWRRKEMPHGL
jgi:hypothetical protein